MYACGGGGGKAGWERGGLAGVHTGDCTKSAVTMFLGDDPANISSSGTEDEESTEEEMEEQGLCTELMINTIFTLSIGTSYLLTILVLKFEIVHYINC